MKAYKVVFVDLRGVRWSSETEPKLGFRRRYQTDRWTHAKGGTFLFVFFSLNSAVEFRHDRAGFEVWECEVETIMPLGQRCSAFTMGYWATWWERWLRGDLAIDCLHVSPRGCFGAKKVKLIKRAR